MSEDATGFGTVTADEIEVGDAAPTLVIEELERKDFVKYAGASGDFNPIHYDEPLAKEAGYSSVFAQGMLTAGFVSRVVTDWFGIETIETFSTRFRRQVFPGDSVTVTGEVIAVDEADDGTRVTAALEATNQNGDVVVTGSATAHFE